MLTLGGVTLAVHLLSYTIVDASVFKAPPALPRVLVHIIDTACPDSGQEISKPTPLVGHIDCRPISKEGVLQQEGLLDVFGAPNAKLHAHASSNGWDGLSGRSQQQNSCVLLTVHLTWIQRFLAHDASITFVACCIGLSCLLLQWQPFALCGCVGGGLAGKLLSYSRS
jgi:hypothetical protein